VLAAVKRDALKGEWGREEEEAYKADIRAQYDAQGNAYYATARLWVAVLSTPPKRDGC
jgi:3-methylcrotonyl-CoA carboxylase beta subunit